MNFFGNSNRSSITLLALFFTTLFAVLVLPSSNVVVDAATYSANGNTVVIKDVTDTEITFVSIINSVVTITNVVTGKFSFGIIANSTVLINSSTCSGDTYFVGLSTLANVTIQGSTFSAGAVRLGPVAQTTAFTFTNNIVAVPSTLTSVNSAVHFQSDTEVSGTLKISGNTLSIDSTSSGFVGCIQFSPTNLTVNSLVISNNKCTVSAYNPVGIIGKSATRITLDLTISGNTFSLTSNGTTGGVSNCVRFENFVSAGIYDTTGTGFFYLNNYCTGRATGTTDGVVILTTSTVTTTSPAIESVRLVGNTFDLYDSGSEGTSRAFVADFVLPSGDQWGTAVTSLTNNVIMLTANRGVVAFDFAKGVNTYAVVDFSYNNVTINAASASTTTTDYTAIVRVAQQESGGLAALQTSFTFFKNYFAFSGSYATGFIAVSDGTGASSTKSVSGSWLFRTNTLVASPSSATLFSPTMDVSSGQGNLTMSCTTYNGATLPSAQVAVSLSGVGSGYTNDIGCDACSYDLFCNPDASMSVHYNSSDSECYCRCNNYRYRLDPLPRGYQCRYRPGEEYTNSKTMSKSRNETRSRTFTPIVITAAPQPPSSSSLSTGAIAGIAAAAGLLLLLLLILLICCCCPCCPWFLCCAGKKDDDENKDKDRKLEDEELYDGATFTEDGSIIPKEPLDLPIVPTYLDHRDAEDEADRREYDDLMDMEPSRNGGELTHSRPAKRDFILAEPSQGQGSGSTPQPSPIREEEEDDDVVDNSRVNYSTASSQQHHQKTSPRRPGQVDNNNNTSTASHRTLPSKQQQQQQHRNNGNDDDGYVVEMTPNARMSPRSGGGENDDVDDSNYRGVAHHRRQNNNSHSNNNSHTNTPRRF